MPRHFLTALLLCGLLAGCGEVEPDQVPPAGEKPAADVSPAASSAVPQDPPKPLPPAPIPDKPLFARSFINKPAPELVVEQWLTSEPDRRGKMVLIDFWADWCDPCIETIPKLNQLHRNFKDRLVVIGLSEDPPEVVRDHRGARINYAVATDTKRRTYNALGVTHIPHAVLIDPTGIVRWQGLPSLKGHELTEDVIEELLDTYVP